MAGITRVENEALSIEMLEQDDALAGHSVRVHRCNGHSWRVYHLHLERLLHPFSKLIVGVVAKVSAAQFTQ